MKTKAEVDSVESKTCDARDTSNQSIQGPQQGAVRNFKLLTKGKHKFSKKYSSRQQ